MCTFILLLVRDASVVRADAKAHPSTNDHDDRAGMAAETTNHTVTEDVT